MGAQKAVVIAAMCVALVATATCSDPSRDSRLSSSEMDQARKDLRAYYGIPSARERDVPPEREAPSGSPLLSDEHGIAEVNIPPPGETFQDARSPSPLPSEEEKVLRGDMRRLQEVADAGGFSDSEDTDTEAESETETIGSTVGEDDADVDDDAKIEKEEKSFGTFDKSPSAHRMFSKKLKAPGYEEIHHRRSVTVRPLRMCHQMFDGLPREEKVEPVTRRQGCMNHLHVRADYRLCLDLMNLLVAGPTPMSSFQCLKRAHAITSHWGMDSTESGPVGQYRTKTKIDLFDKFKANGIDWDALNKIRLDGDPGKGAEQINIFEKIYSKLEHFNEELGEKITFSKQEYLTRTPTHCLHTATLANYGGRKVVVKRPIVYTEYMYENSLTELYLNENMRRSNVQSDRIVGYYGYFKEFIGSGDIAECPGFMYVGLVFEYMPYSLDRLLNEHRLALMDRPDVVRAIMVQLVQGVRVMQSRFGIVHRDIKVDNVLMAEVDEDLIPSSINLKYADFDRSMSVNDIPEHYREVGEMTTMTCMPPENLIQTALENASAKSLLPAISELTNSDSENLEALELLLGEIDTPFYRRKPNRKDAAKAIERFPSMPHLLKFDVFSVGVIFMEIVSGSRYWLYESFTAGFAQNRIVSRDTIDKLGLNDRGPVYRSPFDMFLLQMVVLSKALSNSNSQAYALYPWGPLERNQDRAHQLTEAAVATSYFRSAPSVFDVARIFGLEAFTLLSKMLHFNPTKRASVTELMDHPYFTPAYTNIMYTPLGKVDSASYQRLVHQDVNVMRELLAKPRSCFPSSSMFSLNPNSLHYDDLEILGTTIVHVENRLSVEDYRFHTKKEEGASSYDVHIYCKGTSFTDINTVVVQIETWKQSIAVRGPKTVIVHRSSCEKNENCPRFLNEEAEWRIQVPMILLSTKPEYLLMRAEIDMLDGEILCADSAFDWMMVAKWATESFEPQTMSLEDFLNEPKSPHTRPDPSPPGVREDEIVEPIRRIPTPTKSRDPNGNRLRRAESEDTIMSSDDETADEPAPRRTERPPPPSYPAPDPPSNAELDPHTEHSDRIQDLMDTLDRPIHS